ncbi:MAG TPA: glycosyltransferase, partial [Acidobacteriota bacterium]
HLYTETMQSKWWKKSPYYHLVMKRHLQRGSAIHYTTADEANKCHNRLQLHNPAIVVPNGIDLSEFEFLPQKNRIAERLPHLRNKRVILFLGRINWKKGLDILIPAYAALRKTHPDTHLLIAGNDRDRYKKIVKQQLDTLNLRFSDQEDDQTPSSPPPYLRGRNQGNADPNIDVTFAGYLDETAKLEALAGSDLFVLPSYSENFGNSVLEAMACGLPVIVSNKVGLSADVSDSGAGMVIDLQPAALTAAMAHFLDHPQNARECGERGKRLVGEKFTWDKIAGQMRAAFERILNENSRAVIV